jgi:hypothetical protein
MISRCRAFKRPSTIVRRGQIHDPASSTDPRESIPISPNDVVAVVASMSSGAEGFWLVQAHPLPMSGEGS